MAFGRKILLCVLVAILQTFSVQFLGNAKPGRSACVKLLRDLLKHPPRNTKILINIRLSKARYLCHDGFTLSGSETRTCRRGVWREKKEPECLAPRPCGRPEDIPHAKFIGTSFNFKDKLRYECDDGFTLKGPKRRKCGVDGKWSRAPKCLGPCGKPDDIPHAKVEGSSYNYKDTLSYTCVQGYKLNGPNSRTCVGNGMWSIAPTCSRIQCENPVGLTMLNGNITTSDPNYFYGATLLFECNEGYELKGDDTISCLENGWTPRGWPYCTKKVCPNPGRPERGHQFGPRYKTVGSTMRFFCQSGYKLHGSKVRTCLENKEWSGSLTTCQNGNTDCPVLGTPISGRKYGSRYNKGDIVKFQCKPGFVLKGSGIRMCNVNGTWNGTEAICKDELEDSFEDVNITAFNLRKNLIDTLLVYTSINATNMSRDARGRAISTQNDNGLDLVFVIDASTSVKKENFQLGLAFVKKLVNFIAKNSTRSFRDKIRIAAVTYGTDVQLEFNLGDDEVGTIDKAIAAIDNINYMGGATASADALKLVRDVVAQQARFDSDRVLIFITDGKSNVGGSPQRIAKELHEVYHFEIYAIGLGPKIDRTELWQIASNDKRHVVHIRSHQDLDRAIDRAVNTSVDYSSCGESPFDSRGRVVGGENSKRGRWPWQVAIYLVTNKEFIGQEVFLCGGALISRQWVLTAAHCFKRKNKRLHLSPNGYVVYAGVHRLTKKAVSGQRVIPEKIIVHDKYHIRWYRNDIALVKLQTLFELKPFVRTVCLPEKDEQDLAIPDEYGTVAGWGGTKRVKVGERAKTGDISNVLKHSAFKVQRDQLCSNKSGVIPIDSAVTFCAGDGLGKNDTCQGDSGGAFVRETQRGDDKRLAWVAAGIVSWGFGCAQEGQYGYYTRVYPFIDWIKQNMGKNNN